MGDNLMPKANAKSREVFDQLFNRGVRILDRPRVTWTVREKDRIWFESFDLSSCCARRENMHVESMMLQLAVDGKLPAKIECSHLEAWLLSLIIVQSKICPDHCEGCRFLHFRIPLVGLFHGNFLNKIHSDEAAEFFGSLDRFFLGDLFGCNASFERARNAELLGDSSGIHPFNTRDTRSLKVILDRTITTPVARYLAKLTNNEALNLRTIRF